MKAIAVLVLLLAVVPGASHAEDQTRQKILQAIEDIERRNINIRPELRAKVKQYLDSNRKGGATKDQIQAIKELVEYLDAGNRAMEEAEQGDVINQWLLAERYSTGQGRPQNYGEALKWYRKAAEQGHAPAQHSLGGMYYDGTGTPQNYAEAFKWYRKAAEQGRAGAQAFLGFMYDKGKGTPQNYGEALKWYRKAAEQGHASAQVNLGVMYDRGQGTPQNYAEALKWFRKAAEQGHSGAQHNLGVMYHEGEGTPKNDIMAYAWFSIAAAQRTEISKGEDSAKARDGIAEEMTPEQVAKGQALAAEYWKKYVKRR